MAGCDGGAKSSASMEKEACAEKKYGGIAPKKPLISKDHERAYFDSADWVLGKVREENKIHAPEFRNCACSEFRPQTSSVSNRPLFLLACILQQAANSSTRAAVESLKPKLKRTPHHQLPPRKPTCASS
ncbi:uncharacterized protein LOC8083999 isoform X1 [Sorghum bicolor]|uniref:uncharacterized protein LOC8083999 isoform X1 n=1 Tax=Sorghum bicolor TaxID=4558 RepID=UPI000B4259D7|nr:uncharacterized protein LOC8083999 isoform X1 [Sorghum bicolor]|eukprot:XP_021312831.1 uncharacterized protein LOC8083999 isoform X1 [Sorghum bicolor]